MSYGINNGHLLLLLCNLLGVLIIVTESVPPPPYSPPRSPGAFGKSDTYPQPQPPSRPPPSRPFTEEEDYNYDSFDSD